MTSRGKTDPFDKAWLGIHRKASELADIVGASFLAIHVTADGNAKLSGSRSVDLVASSISGTAAFKQHLGLGKLADIDWQEHKRKPLQCGAKERSAAWRGRGKTLNKAVDNSLVHADRPFLLVILWDSLQLVRASPQGQQLLASGWWQCPVMEAFRNPVRLPPLPGLAVPMIARRMPHITNGRRAAGRPALGGAGVGGSSIQAVPALAAQGGSHGLAACEQHAAAMRRPASCGM